MTPSSVVTASTDPNVGGSRWTAPVDESAAIGWANVTRKAVVTATRSPAVSRGDRRGPRRVPGQEDHADGPGERLAALSECAGLHRDRLEGAGRPVVARHGSSGPSRWRPRKA